VLKPWLLKAVGHRTSRTAWMKALSLENLKKRLKALEAKIAAEELILTDAQIAALEKKQQDDKACGEIEAAHPGYLDP